MRESVFEASLFLDTSGISELDTLALAYADRFSGSVFLKPCGRGYDSSPEEMISVLPNLRGIDGIGCPYSRLILSLLEVLPNFSSAVRISTEGIESYMLFSSPLPTSDHDYLFDIGSTVPYIPSLPGQDAVCMAERITEALIERSGSSYAAVLAEGVGLITLAPDPLSAVELAISVDHNATIELHTRLIGKNVLK